MSSLLFGIYSRMGDGRIWRLWLAWSVTRKLSRRPKLASWTWRRVCVSFAMFYAWRPIEKGADELASKSFNIQCTHVGQLTAAAFTWYVDFMVLSSVAKWRAVSCIVYIINTVSWIKKLLERNAVLFFGKSIPRWIPNRCWPSIWNRGIQYKNNVSLANRICACVITCRLFAWLRTLAWEIDGQGQKFPARAIIRGGKE